MKARILLVAVLALFSVAAVAGGHGQSYSLQKAAAELDYAAKDYAKQVQYYAHSSRYKKAARRFARATADFCYLVERGADHYELKDAYATVESRFHRLHRHASSYQNASYGYSKVPDIYKVKYAYEDVSNILNRKYDRYSRNSHNRGYDSGRVLKRRLRDAKVGISFGYRFD